MKRRDIEFCYRLFKSFANIRVSPKFAYMVSKNLKIVEYELGVLEQTRQTIPKEFLEYDDKRTELCKLYSLKNAETNEPIIETNNYGHQSYAINPEQQILFDTQLAELQETYKDALVAGNEFIQKMGELLDEDFSAAFIKVKIDDFPTGLTQAQFDFLFAEFLDET